MGKLHTDGSTWWSWKSTWPKPKNFRFIRNDGKYKIYSYSVPVYISKTDYDKEYTEIVDIVDFQSVYSPNIDGYLEINNDHQMKEIDKIIGFSDVIVNNEYFRRDSISFEFLQEIVIRNKDIEKYKLHKRRIKLQNIKNKLGV